MTIQSVDRALQILSFFSHKRSLVGISELSQLTQLPKGTIHGLVKTMVDRGFLVRDSQTRRYRLGIKLHELGILVSENLDIVQKGAPFAHRLSRKTQSLCRIAIWDGDAVVIVLSARPRPRASFPHQIGPRVRAYCSAMGKAVLAHLGEEELKGHLNRTERVPFTPSTMTRKKMLKMELEKTKARGYSLDREEAVRGLSCLGAPVFGRDGSLEGSLSISGASKRILGPRKETFLEELLRTADEISQHLGYFPEKIQ